MTDTHVAPELEQYIANDADLHRHLWLREPYGCVDAPRGHSVVSSVSSAYVHKKSPAPLDREITISIGNWRHG